MSPAADTHNSSDRTPVAKEPMTIGDEDKSESDDGGVKEVDGPVSVVISSRPKAELVEAALGRIDPACEFGSTLVEAPGL